jgi:peptidoglycan/LPS O-acetylase OafA/YrhL
VTPLATSAAPLETATRNTALDALKAAMTVLVVFHHSALTYGAIGSWFYRERAPDGSVSSLLLVLLCTVNQAFFMGLFFLIAGYFTPPALAQHGMRSFLRERLVRLSLPLLAFGFVLGPLTVALAHAPTPSEIVPLWGRLMRHGSFYPGPLWFAEALFVFGMGAAIWHAVPRRNRAPVMASACAFPSHRSLSIAALGCGAVAFALRLYWPVGVTVGGLQLGYFASYVLLFVAGCVASTRRWPVPPPEDVVRVWRRVAWLALPTLPVLAWFGPSVEVLKPGPEGGWNLPSLVYAFWEPLVAWGVIAALVHQFHVRINTASRWWRSLGRRAYAMYVIHPPVLVGVALAWRTVEAPALVKFGVTGASACVLCFWLSGALLRIGLVRRVM